LFVQHFTRVIVGLGDDGAWLFYLDVYVGFVRFGLYVQGMMVDSGFDDPSRGMNAFLSRLFV